MDQNSVLVEKLESKPTNDNNGQPGDLSTNGQRGILTPEFSNLITSVHELANEMIKTVRLPGNNLGLYQMRSS